MREPKVKKEKTQTSRAAWIDAAYELLITTGVESVKVMPLAKKMGTSRTSFYWLFKDREEVLNALIERWQQNTAAVVKQSERYAANVVEAMLNVFDCWFDGNLFDSEFEHAVRSWGLQDKNVAESIREADTTRLEAIRKMFMRYGVERDEADTRARTVYLIQIGYISMHLEESGDIRLARVPRYVEIFTGEPCEQTDLDRFAARHTTLFTEAGLLAAKQEKGNGRHTDHRDSGG